MFDDFDYANVNEADNSFNRWTIIDGLNGPPANAIYSANNVRFYNDPTNSANKLMALDTRVTVNGNSKTITHARIETEEYVYRRGTYAARVYFSDAPTGYGDANIQTFFTIVSHELATDETRYSELDIIEYMAYDRWSAPSNLGKPVRYTTSYAKYIPNSDPFIKWRAYNEKQESLAGWHTFVASCTDGVNVRYYMDGNAIGVHSYSDGDHPNPSVKFSVYPRSDMSIAFANWVWNSSLGAGTQSRTTTMQVDWVLFQRDQALSPAQVNTFVGTARSQGLKRQNLAGEKYFAANNPPPTGAIRIEAENYTYQSGMQKENCSEGGENLAYIDANDWASYTNINIPSSGTYKVSFRLASIYAGKTLMLEKNGSQLLTTVTSPNTGNWQVWQTVEANVYLDAGSTALGINSPTGGLNLNWIELSKVNNAVLSSLQEAKVISDDVAIYPNPVEATIELTNGAQSDGSEVRIIDQSGNVAYRGSVVGGRIQVGVLKSGNYILHIKKGDMEKRIRFIKK